MDEWLGDREENTRAKTKEIKEIGRKIENLKIEIKELNDYKNFESPEVDF